MLGDANQRLGYILDTFAASQCADVRDKVYGILSLVGFSRRITVDYSKSPSAVFFDVIEKIVEDEGYLRVEEHCDVALHVRIQMKLDTLSGAEILDFIELKKRAEAVRELPKGSEPVICSRERTRNVG